MVSIAAAIIGALVTIVAAIIAIAAASNAIKASMDVAKGTTKAFELEGLLWALRSRIGKLEGKFYGTLGAQQADAEEKAEQRAAAQHILECEQWFIAKKDGPLSKAAKCECTYCVSMRAAREAARKALVHGHVISTLNGKP